MRAQADLPRRRAGNRNRIIIVAVIAVLFFILTSLRGIAGFYTTFLWYKELKITSVWRGVLGTKILLVSIFTALFFVLLWVNILIVERIAPRFRVAGGDDEIVQRYREIVGPHAGKLRVAVAFVFALLAGTGTSSQWNNYLLFRNAVDFTGPLRNDEQFHRNISFFVFKLPFLAFLVSWAFLALMIVLVVVVVAHYLHGGIRLQAASQRVSPQVKAHVSVLLGGLALVKAVGYYLQRYELNFSTRGFRDGASYTDVKAQLPALQLLILISVVAFFLFLANIRRQGWVLPIIGVGLWAFVSVIVGAIYPAFIQKFKVEPSENNRERPYIRRNIKATRAAFGLDKVETNNFDYNTNLTPADLNNDAETIRNVRLWDPSLPGTINVYKREQELRSYYAINDIDVDRYSLNGKTTQAIVSARELNSNDLPSQSWVNRRLQYTHGYGAIVSPANAVTQDGKPAFAVKDVPPNGEPRITEPRIYYGENTGGYAIVKTGQPELDYQDATGKSQTSSYSGTGGVPMGSIFRRFAFFLRFGDANPLISNLVTSKSRALYIRDIGARVRTAAPFLRYDADPYAVVLDGRIVWVQDAYTTTSRYPYSQRADVGRLPADSGLSSGFNYVRNSVKVVIDAYNGSMKFYLIDPQDPISKLYAKAFPRLFTPGSEMSATLREHLRYPEDLFRVQTNMFGRYHITNPDGFYNAADGWNISQDPGSGDPSKVIESTQTASAQGVITSTTKRMDPAYLLMRLPGESATSFLILQPFVPVSAGDKQQNLSAFMTAKSDPADYGKLQVFVTPRGRQIDGPPLVNARINASSAISKEISLLNQSGSAVRLGNVLVIPIQQSLLYVRPLYVQAAQNPVPQLRKVIVVYGERAEMGDTLQEALTAVFGGAPQTLEANAGAPSPTPGGQTGPAPAAATVADLLAQAQTAFADADAALKVGDLAAFQAKYRQGVELVNKAKTASGTNTTTTTTAPPSSA